MCALYNQRRNIQPFRAHFMKSWNVISKQIDKSFPLEWCSVGECVCLVLNKCHANEFRGVRLMGTMELTMIGLIYLVEWQYARLPLSPQSPWQLSLSQTQIQFYIYFYLFKNSLDFYCWMKSENNRTIYRRHCLFWLSPSASMTNFGVSAMTLKFSAIWSALGGGGGVFLLESYYYGLQECRKWNDLHLLFRKLSTNGV